MVIFLFALVCLFVIAGLCTHFETYLDDDGQVRFRKQAWLIEELEKRKGEVELERRKDEAFTKALLRNKER